MKNILLTLALILSVSISFAQTSIPTFSGADSDMQAQKVRGTIPMGTNGSFWYDTDSNQFYWQFDSVWYKTSITSGILADGGLDGYIIVDSAGKTMKWV